MKRLMTFALISVALLSGCATPEPVVPAAPSLFRDAAFKPPSQPIRPEDAIALSPEMKRFAEGPMASEIRARGVRSGLIEAINTRSQLHLDYDATRTRTAAEAFEARSGNCLSLVMMTAAFAHHFQLPIRFNSVYLEETWTRSSGLYMVAGHVNVSLSRPMAATGKLILGDPELLTIDFLPPEMVQFQRSRVIDERTVLAMYANNRAAESLTVGQVDDAYWWAKAAIDTDPRWLSAYNTLAVLYRRKGLGEAAEAALRHVLAKEPLNSQALSNLVLVLSDAGRKTEATVISEQLAQIQPVPPYKYFDEGVEAMRKGDYENARKLFRQEIARAAYVSEFHFWLGLANWALGDPAATRESINVALENSTTSRDRQLYAAKLAWLDEEKAKFEAKQRAVSDTYRRRN